MNSATAISHEPQSAEVASAASTAPRHSAQGLRSLAESVVCLALAVILVRTFAVEGYMISTGSMAPCLLGYHKRVICPRCGIQFAFGIDEADATAAAGESGGFHSSQLAKCPNCGQDHIDVSRVPPNEGDQLLVQKPAYLFAVPHRWEIIVFRNPQQPTQAYVKRVVGLPGDKLQVIDGDVYANGEVQRKTLAQQHSTRIAVYDNRFVPQDDPQWERRWSDDLDAQTAAAAGFQPKGDGFRLTAAQQTADEQSTKTWNWLVYRNWIRKGGTHETKVALSHWPPEVQFSDYFEAPIKFNEEQSELSCVGALPMDLTDRLLRASHEREFAKAVLKLYEESHIAPVVDGYGYNSVNDIGHYNPVGDLMLSARLQRTQGDGELVFQLTDGRKVYACVIDFARMQTGLFAAGENGALRSAALPQKCKTEAFEFEMSVFDRQVLVAVDGQTLFDPLPVDGSARDENLLRRPARIGAWGLDLQVDSLVVYRDVYYTDGKGLHAIDEPYELADNEYFVLGDNSPISLDSRSWPDGAVPEKHLLGKPFIVHLPSRPGKIQVGERTAYVRVPDFERIRYIR